MNPHGIPSRGRQPDIYRGIIAQLLGRSLRGTEVVHHINGDFTDNHPDNLVALSSQRAHMLIHHYLNRERAGISHLYRLENILYWAGEHVVWASPSGWKSVFGTPALKAVGYNQSERQVKFEAPGCYPD